MKIKNIGLIVDSIRNETTGIGYYTKDVIKSILKIDKKNHYFALDYIENKNVNISQKQVKNPFPILKTYLWHNLLPFVTKNKDLDIIYNFSGCPHWKGYELMEYFFVHDISWQLFPHHHKLGRVLWFKLLFKRTLKNSYKIVVNSENTKQDLIKIYHVDPAKILIIYPNHTMNAVKVVAPIIKLPKRYILFVGTLEPRKNITTLIKAFHRLQNNLNIHLIVCGKKGWNYSEIYRLAYKLNLTGRIIFTGYLSDPEKKYLYQYAEAFVYPSVYEGFGIPPLEAMANGCPVITSNISSLPEVVGDAGILINPTKVDQLSAAIKKLLLNKMLRDNLVKKGYSQSEKFLLKNQVLRFESLINSY